MTVLSPLSTLLALAMAVTGGTSAVATPQDGVPKGEVTPYRFADSRIFPGTERDYWVYVPAQYDPGTPACLFVCQDGIRFEAPAAFDALIASGEMPVTIGVFVMHGKVPPPVEGALPRFNRSYEYDGLGDAYARFLIEELLPEVETKTTADGRPIRLSKDPNDRAIAGASSGAICAFTAAWERPDAFRRVFSAIGTYVGLRGGDDYPTLIRKTEPKPIRVFLEDGSNDLNIYGGDWWMANQTMERALTFAGYEVEHSWGDGGHNAEHATAIFADAMRWLWKDWPEPVRAGLGSPQLQEILLPGEGWEQVAEGGVRAGGLAANDRGEVVFTDANPFLNDPSSRTLRIAADGEIVPVLDKAKVVGGQAVGPDGRLYAVSAGTGEVVAYDEAGGEQVVASGLWGPDLVVRHDGGVFVTSASGFGGSPGQIVFIPPGGAATAQVVGNEPGGLHALTLSPDQTLLYAADANSRWVTSYQARADGSLAFGQRYFHLHVPDDDGRSGAAKMAVDRDGRLYVATRLGVQVCDQAGRVNAIIPTPGGPLTSLCFGGPGFDTLFVTVGNGVYARKVKARGAMPFQPPITPAPPRL